MDNDGYTDFLVDDLVRVYADDETGRPTHWMGDGRIVEIPLPTFAVVLLDDGKRVGARFDQLKQLTP